MKKILIAAILFLPILLSAQDMEPDFISVETAVQRLQEQGIYSAEDTNLNVRGGKNINLETVPLSEEDYLPKSIEVIDYETLTRRYDDNKMVVKITLTPERNDRGLYTTTILLPEPVFVMGISKTITNWIKGSSNTQKIKLITQDIYGIEYKHQIYWGYEPDYKNDRETYWRDYTIALPPGFTQSDYRGGIYGFTFLGYEITFYDGTPAELFIDVLTSVTDFFMFTSPRMDMDAMKNNW